VLTYIYQMKRLPAQAFARLARPQPTFSAEFAD
jgi:hypothetical protein